MLEHRLAVIIVILTFLLLILGGIVHNTGSSLACPDWPLCYGSLFPEMKGGVAIEHGHRLLAASVGLLSIVLAFLLSKRRKGDRLLRRIGWGAVFLVIFQGLLGGLTVIYRLPAAISTAHLALSMLFFALVIVIAWRTSLTPLPLAGEGHDPSREPRRVRAWLLATTLLVYFQNLLGALVRHTGSGLACPDIPFCYGLLWPVGLHPSLTLHMAHRWNGILVVLFVLAVPWMIFREGQKDLRIRLLSLAALALVLIQVGLGIGTVLTSLGVITVTLHLGVAALLLGTMVSLWMLNSSKPSLECPQTGRSAHPGVNLS